MAVAEIVAVFFRSQNRPVGARVQSEIQKWKENNDGTNKWEYHEPYVCLGVIVFKQVLYHLSQGLGMIDVDAWNRLSSPTCQVRWNRFTCVERNSKLMPLETRRVSPRGWLQMKKAPGRTGRLPSFAHWSCSQIPRPHQEERREYQMIQPLALGPTYRSPDVCPSYVAFWIGALKLYINVDVEKYPATQSLVPSGSLQNYGVTVGPWHPWQPKDLRTSYYKRFSEFSIYASPLTQLDTTLTGFHQGYSMSDIAPELLHILPSLWTGNLLILCNAQIWQVTQPLWGMTSSMQRMRAMAQRDCRHSSNAMARDVAGSLSVHWSFIFSVPIPAVQLKTIFKYI